MFGHFTTLRIKGLKWAKRKVLMLKQLKVFSQGAKSEKVNIANPRGEWDINTSLERLGSQEYESVSCT